MTEATGGGRAPWPDLSGRLVDGGHVLAVRIYFEDTDFTGIVYHANYLRFMERARSDFLRLRGVEHTALLAGSTGESLAFAVRHMEIDFHSPARIDEVVEVRTRPRTIRGARIVLDQQIVRDDRCLVAARVTIAVVGGDGRPRRIPALVADRLAGGATPSD